MDNPNQTGTKLESEPALSRAPLLEQNSFRLALRRAVVRPLAVLALAMLLLVGLLTYLFSSADAVDHTNQVLAQISRVEKLVVDMETGVRGFRITGDDSMLEPFQRAVTVFSNELSVLENQLRGDSYQLSELGALRRSHATWSEFATNVRERVRAQLPADVAAHLRGKALMDEVRGHISAMQQHERRLLAERSATRGQLRAVVIGAFVLSALVLAPIMAISIRRAFLRVNRSYRDALGTMDAERERLRVTLFSIGDAVVATDANGCVTYLNPAAEELTGWTSIDAVGQPLNIVFKIINEHSRQIVENPVENVLREGRVVGLANHTLLIAKDGRETPIADSAAPIRDARGAITGVVLVFRDQTAERDAAAKVEWLASFPEGNPNPVMELDLETGEVVYANTFTDQVFPDLRAQGLRHGFFAGVNEAAQPLIEDRLAFVRREMAMGEHCYAQTIRYLPETKRLRIYGSDITETKRIEAQLRESEERFRQIFEHAATGIAITDRDGKFQRCNPACCALLGYTEEEFRRINFSDLIHPDDRAANLVEIRRLLTEDLPFFEIENRYLGKDGQPVWVHTFVSLLRDSSGSPTHMVALVTDVRERKRSELLLDSQKRSLEMVVSGAPLCDVLTRLARVVEEQSDGKATASILLLDSDGLLRNGASPSLPADYLEALDGLEPCANIGTCCAAAATGQVVVTPDIDADPRWQTLKHLPLNLGFVAAWSQPITSSDGRLLGTFGTYFRERREPTSLERETVEILARTAALAIERRHVEDDRKRFVSLAENSSDFIGMCGPDLLPFFVNRAGLAMVGLDDLEQARRMPVKEFFFPEDQERVINQFFPSVLAEGSGEIEIRFRHFKTGEALWMLYNVWVVTDDQGQFAGLATVSRDITERKHGEDAHAKLAAIVESSEDAIISKDLNGIITSWNKGAERLFGYTAPETIGHPITILIPADRLDEEPRILASIRRGEFVEHFETVRRRKDGKLVDISLAISPIVDRQGRIVGASKIARDITDRKRAEDALRASEERYRSLFDSIDEGFCVIEMIFDANQRPVDYRFIEVNPAFERQAGMHGVTGKRMLEFVSEIEPHWLENYGRVAMTGEPIRFADEYKSLGSWFDVYAFRVGDPESRRVAVIFNNITKRKLAEDAVHRSRAELAAANEELARRAKQLDETVEKRTAELRETVQQLETFSYSIVHDMRAPLRSMRSFAGFLHQGYNDKLDDAARDYLRRIMDSAARMDALIRDVLNYSRLSQQAVELALIDLDKLVPEIIEQYPQFQEKAGTIEVERPLPKVAGNTALLTQVFSNLLSNALKFVPNGDEPQVRVRAETNNNNAVRIWVEDNGIGVPAEQREKIFGLFQRLHRPDEYPGTGVGLAIVKRAVEKMGGKAGVESERGKGSRFWFELRIAGQPAGAVTLANATSPLHGPAPLPPANSNEHLWKG